MNTYTRILNHYQQHVEEDGQWISDENKHCCATLMYKYRMVRMNCGMMLKDKNLTATSFRKIRKFG
eukprot:6838099-Ditylum_brightwellii.AAC.1